MRLILKQLLILLIAIMGTVNYALADTIWIDVRSAEEYAEDHIDGDLNIIHTAIAEEIDSHIKDKNTEIKLYCRSGKRAGIALQQLQQMGYTNVTNAGGIADARAQRNISSSDIQKQTQP